MRRTGDTWEYIATYVDDLAMVLKNPTEVTNALCNKYGYKLKGVGPITYHLGSDYKRDPDGTLYVSAESYIEKMNESYERNYGTKPKEYSSPLEKNDHPELDNSTLVSPDKIVLF
jgi:hypothetical protein